MATVLSRLNQQFSVDELKPNEADFAYPLVRAIAPDVSLGTWRDYVRRRSIHGGLLALFGADGEITGLLSYRLGERLRHGTVLALDDFVTFELSRAAPGRQALLGAAEELARQLGCTGLELRVESRGVADGTSARARGWAALGFELESAIFVKPL